MLDTACLDWQARMAAGAPLVPDLPLNEAEAGRALRIFNRLRLPDVIGQPTLAEATGPWFSRIVESLFGSYDPETNRRAIQEVFLLVPKKNGKSTNAAAVMVTAAIINRRPNAELLLIAPTKEIADISFRQAAGMIKADPELAKLFHPQRHIRTITHRISGAVIQIKAADTDAITGVKATFILIDETHVFANKAHAADVFVELRGALAARPDGFLFQISTQSKAPPAGVFARELRRARDVRDGLVKLPLLAVIYEMPPAILASKGWRDPSTFRLVNPNMGRSVDTDFLLREMATAERDGPEQLALFASQHLNVEIGMGLRSDRWAGAEYWEDTGDKTLTLDALLARSEVAVVGVDGGGLDDLLGLAVLGRCRETRRWLHWGRAWAHPVVLKRRQSEAPKLRDFAAAGDLRLVDRLGDDIAEVVEIVCAVRDAGLLPEKHGIGLDPAGIGAILDAMTEAGIDGGQVVAVSQGWRLGGAIKSTERKLAEGALMHGSSAMMAWCVGNAKVEPRGNAILITKQASGTAKIDPLMALFNAAELMARAPVVHGGDVPGFLAAPVVF
jgi:phage terminase large subunit-like protein